jgi:TonB family protein
MEHAPISSLAQARAELAYSDDLTGLFSRRILGALFDQLWQELLAGHATLAVIVIDLDHFKEVNDTYGHLVGDQVLKDTACILRNHFRGDDIVVRYGGDEFVILLPGVGQVEAGRLAERARLALAEHQFAVPDGQQPMTVPVSFSLGVAVFPGDGASGEVLIDLADQRLLEDKRARHAREKPLDASVLGVRVATTVVAALAIAAIGAGLWLLRSSGSATSPPPTPIVVKGLDPAREAELLAEIKQLQEQLAAVKVERARATDTGSREGSERRIDELTRTIARLEESVGRPAVEGTATPATTAPARTPASALEAEVAPTLGARRTAGPGDDSPTSTGLEQPPEQPPVSVQTAPVLIQSEAPVYPEVARKLRKEASVEFRVVVSAAGKVVEVDQTGPTVGFGMDLAARNAAFRASYRPGTRNGAPVDMVTTLVIHFRLTGT